MREGAPVQWRTIALTVGVLAGVVVLGGALVALDVWLHPEERSPLGVLDDGAEVQRVDRRRWLTGEETELRVVLHGETLGSAPLELPRVVTTHGALVVCQRDREIVVHDRTLRAIGRIEPSPGESFHQIDWLPDLLVTRSRAEAAETDDRLRGHALPTVELAFEATVPRGARHVLLDGQLVIVTGTTADLVTREGLERLTPEGADDVAFRGGILSWLDPAGQQWAQRLDEVPVRLAWGTLPGEPPDYGRVIGCDGSRFVSTASAIFELRGWRGYVASFDARTGARQWLLWHDEPNAEAERPCSLTGVPGTFEGLELRTVAAE